jgi:predicted anti-sigma-YlaC factor YlaD
MSHLALPRWTDIIEKEEKFTTDERAHLDECEQCQSLFLALARQTRNEAQNRKDLATRNHSAA